MTLCEAGHTLNCCLDGRNATGCTDRGCTLTATVTDDPMLVLTHGDQCMVVPQSVILRTQGHLSSGCPHYPWYFAWDGRVAEWLMETHPPREQDVAETLAMLKGRS